MWGHGLDSSGSGYGQVAVICEFGNDLRDQKMRGISWLAGYRLASQEGLGYIE